MREYVRAFKFEKIDGIIQMHCKGSPSNAKWCGMDGIPDGPGFVMLNSVPSGAPQLVPPSKEPILKPEEIKQLENPNVANTCSLYPEVFSG